MHWTQVFLVAALTVYLAAFAVILIAVRRSTGASPMGHDGGHRLAALLNKVAALLLLLTAISYSLDGRSVDWLGRIALLDGPLAQGFGVAALVLAGVCIVWVRFLWAVRSEWRCQKASNPWSLTASTALCATRWRCRWTCWPWACCSWHQAGWR